MTVTAKKVGQFQLLIGVTVFICSSAALHRLS